MLLKTLSDEHWEFIGKTRSGAAFQNLHHDDEVLVLKSARYLCGDNVFIFTVDEGRLYVEHRYHVYSNDNPPVSKVPKVKSWLDLNVAL